MTRKLSPPLLALCALACLAAPAFGQTTPGVASAPAAGVAADGDPSIAEVLRLLREQREELARLRAKLDEQTREVEALRERVERGEQAASHGAARPATFAGALYSKDGGAAVAGTADSARTQDVKQSIEERVARVEDQVKKTSESLSKQLGSITFSGDLRLRYEFLHGQLNAQANAQNPAIIGNELSARNRLRMRARLAVRGRFGEQFDWGLRLATGSFSDAASGNQTLTDFFNRKPFALDQAYLTYRPKAVPGLQLQGGKFEAPWMKTELIFDVDIQHEGLNESYSRDLRAGALRNLTFVAWQLPFLERNSAFVRNPDGTLNFSETRRQGRDLALLGAQLRARIQPSKNSALTLAAADFYFSGTQFITPVQFLGGQAQFPVTVTIPATATTPAQTVAGLVSVPRDMLVAGNANLGLSSASNNAVNRDGRLASGFNLVNLTGRLDLTRSKRFPVALILDFVANTQARRVTTAGAGGADVVRDNDENKGFWAELQVGKARERGDVLFGYTFLRVEKDAVLSPFNFDELVQGTDVRAHRLSFSYAADPHVVLTVTGLFSQRANGLLGPFGATPAGSLNRPASRLQMDTVFRF